MQLKLNQGWVRLWVVAVAAWFAVAGVVTWQTWPEQPFGYDNWAKFGKPSINESSPTYREYDWQVQRRLLILIGVPVGATAAIVLAMFVSGWVREGFEKERG